MKGQPEERAVLLARYIIEKEATVRMAASFYGISKSTVHKDVTERLMKKDPVLCEEVRTLLEHNKAVRHLRGGEATKQKYKEQRKG